ncbi:MULTISPECIES: sugar transferase [Paenibacillus]|uniref:sugar transferase n=1 Tax=Paenibacillus TaxID=44249 RepID=UPI00037F566B|nr:sugar transferase [Paenibacillus massiliensis]
MSMENLPDDYEAVVPGKTFYMPYGTKKVQDKTSYLVTKRILDILLSGIGLIVLLPLFVLVGILIKLEDPKGSVFFKQTRVGKNEKLFSMFKFRSMVSNAEELKKDLMAMNEVSGAMFKIKNDPRITRIGRFLRKTSIDEIPQLWNVLRGDMSLVGPRPPLPSEVEEYSDYDKQRLIVTPGCTGYWQVSARNSVGFEEMVQMDLKYIHVRNTWLDLKIIFKTGVIMLFSRDAY